MGAPSAGGCGGGWHPCSTGRAESPVRPDRSLSPRVPLRGAKLTLGLEQRPPLPGVVGVMWVWEGLVVGGSLVGGVSGV